MDEKRLMVLENIITKYLQGESETETFCDELSCLLSNNIARDPEHKLDFKVIVSHMVDDHSFYGIYVIPTTECLDNFTRRWVNDLATHDVTHLNQEPVGILQTGHDRWCTDMHSFVVEFDDMMFDRSVVNFTAKEMAALLLYEIGTVIFEDTIPDRFCMATKDRYYDMTLHDKATAIQCSYLYAIPIMKACMQRNWTGVDNRVTSAYLGNETIEEYGLRPYLEDALKKCIKAFGAEYFNEAKKDAAEESDVLWVTRMIQDPVGRKKHLKDEICYIALQSNSEYVTTIALTVLQYIGGRLREKYTGAVVEATSEILYGEGALEKYDIINYLPAEMKLDSQIHNSEMALESIFNKRKKIRAELPSQFEIDAIGIEIDKITNQHDRIFVLDLIYELLDRINTFEEAISLDKTLQRKWDAKVVAMKAELERYRKAVLEKKIVKERFGVFVSLKGTPAEMYEG